MPEQGYAAARSAVAVSDSPTGPFRYLRSMRPDAGQLPFDMTAEEHAVLDTLDAAKYARLWTPEWPEAIRKGLFVKRDLEGGQMARDMQLFVDDDGKAYHIFSSEDNLTLHIAELSDDYLSHTGKYVRVAPGGHNEARLFSAPSIWGPWTQLPNPCVGPKSEITFGGQSTFILRLPGADDRFIFMADIWRPKHPSDARYIWLPVRFKEGVPYVEWMDQWNLGFFDRPIVEQE